MRDPGLNPLELWVLHTVETAGAMTGERAYLFSSEAAAEDMGEFLKAGKPPEVGMFEFAVVALEGPPGAPPAD